jgi:very-short-patch-repair endonuclease
MLSTMPNPGDNEPMGTGTSLAARQCLEHHAERRLRGIPTISVLVGDGAAAYQLWRERDPSGSRVLVSWSTESRLPLFESWLSVVIDRCGLGKHILRFLARHSNEDLISIQAQIANATEYSLDVYWQSLALPRSAEWLKLYLWQTREGRANGMELAPKVADWLRCNHDPATCLFNPLLALYEQNELPGLWIATHAFRDPRSQGELSRQIMPLITLLCEAIPSLPIAVCVSREVMKAYLDGEPESHAKALFREGLIDEGVGETGQLDRQRTAPDPAPTAPDSAADRARSENERFLFTQLESRPQTAGVFVLNQKSDYRFGSKRLEIDLFSETYSIAIEIDGFRHFQDPEAYRRDRKKDLMLQNLDILVLRFLADDVVRNLEQILATIDETISSQRSRLKGQKDRVSPNETGKD